MKKIFFLSLITTSFMHLDAFLCCYKQLPKEILIAEKIYVSYTDQGAQTDPTRTQYTDTAMQTDLCYIPDRKHIDRLQDAIKAINKDDTSALETHIQEWPPLLQEQALEKHTLFPARTGTLLDCAIEEGAVDCVVLLLKNGLQKSPKTTADYLLIKAIEKQDIAMCTQAIQWGAQVDACEKKTGWVPLSAAARTHNTAIIDCLLQQGACHYADMVNTVLEGPGTSAQKLSTIQHLVTKGFRYNCFIKKTPLMIAGGKGLSAIFTYLLGLPNTKNTINAYTESKCTVYDLVNDDAQMCAAIEKLGGLPYDELMRQKRKAQKKAAADSEMVPGDA